MFTGLVQLTGTLTALDGPRLRIEAPLELAEGDSVAVNGVWMDATHPTALVLPVVYPAEPAAPRWTCSIANGLRASENPGPLAASAGNRALTGCERWKSRTPPCGGGASRHASSSASDDDEGGIQWAIARAATHKN